jgi:hypothetical protein
MRYFVLVLILIGVLMTVTNPRIKHVDPGQYLDKGEYYSATGHTVDYALVRSAGYVVAAADATNAEKQGADVVCDGTQTTGQDDVEIQAGLDSLTNGGKLYLSSGTFYISSPIYITSYQQIIGANRGATILKVANSADCNVIQTLSTDVARYFITIRDLTIDGNKDNNTTGNGITLYRSWYTSLENLDIIDMSGKGIYCANPGSSNNNVQLLNIELRLCDGTGIQLDDQAAYDSFLANCRVYSCGMVDGYNVFIGLNGQTQIYYMNASTTPASGVNVMFGSSNRGNYCYGLCITDTDDAATGLYIYDESAYNTGTQIHGGYFYNQGTGTHTGYGVHLAGYVTANKKVVDFLMEGVRVNGYAYSVNVADARVEDAMFVHNHFTGYATAAVTNSGTRTVIKDNEGYIAPGEIRTLNGSISTLTENAYNSVDNPYGQNVLVLDETIYISTKATSGSPRLDCGIGSSATTDYTTVFDDITCETVGPYHSTNTTTIGKQTSPILWQAGTGNRYFNHSIKAAAATGMVGTYSIRVMGV